ncbi:hypothetical protein [Shinella sp. M31]|uniref:hypothetical protein n=1 Tax=Shinella sp. M31 TaxID=3368615 RepID=UPI0028D27BAB|nr:hypothetical protein [uncultured Shinella sp.]
MRKSRSEMDALISDIVNEPKRDNSAYLAAIAEARDAIAKAEAHFGVPVKMTTKSKAKANGKFVVKLIFEKAD